jgi:hypothetical protein
MLRRGDHQGVVRMRRMAAMTGAILASDWCRSETHAVSFAVAGRGSRVTKRRSRMVCCRDGGTCARGHRVQRWVSLCARSLKWDEGTRAPVTPLDSSVTLRSHRVMNGSPVPCRTAAKKSGDPVTVGSPDSIWRDYTSSVSRLPSSNLGQAVTDLVQAWSF